MNNIISNIVNKKQNLSYPFIFKKIAKYYWNESQIREYFNDLPNQCIQLLAIKNKWYKLFKFFNYYEFFKLACKSGEIEIVKKFKFDFEKAKKMFCFYNLLNEVVQNGHFKVFEYLLNIFPLDYYLLHEEGLQIAIENGHTDFVKFFIEKGANISKNSYYNEDNYIFIAVKKGHIEIVKLLIDCGVDIDYELMEHAARKGNLEIIQILTENWHPE